MGVQFLHTGEPVLVIEEGTGTPGEYRVGANGAQHWTDNADYRPAKVVRLGAVEEVEQGQLAGSSYDDTSTAARAAAIAEGTHPDRDDTQFVHEAAPPEGVAGPVGGGSPVVGADPVATEDRTPLGEHAGTVATDQGALTDPERDELNRLREQQANQPDPGRQTGPPETLTT